MQNKPPKITTWLLAHLTKEENIHSIVGDAEEDYKDIRQNKGIILSYIWFWFQVIISIPSFVKNTIYWSCSMLKNYLKIALRNLVKNKAHSTINILGLSLGLASFILIYLYVVDEFSYDRFHKKADSIYRIVNSWIEPDGSVDHVSSSLPAVMGESFLEYFPEVEYMTRFTGANGVVRYDENKFQERIRLVDSAFFDMFTFPLIYGNASTVLQNDNSIVLTKKSAQKYFDEENPLGKILTLAFGQNSKDFCITGIAENPPPNSTLQFDLLIHITNLKIAWRPNAMSNWGDFSIPYFIQLPKKISPDHITSKFPHYIKQAFAPFLANMKQNIETDENYIPIQFGLQKMSDIHLDNSVSGGINPTNSYILLGIGFIVLIIACINFMNLSIGKSSSRTIEIGVRKVVGADRRQLINQFWCEAIFTVFISMILGLFLSFYLLPVFNDISTKQLFFSSLVNGKNMISLAVIMLLVGAISGSYPAFMMSLYKPAEILRGKLKIKGKNYFMKSLVVTQFSLSIFLILSTLILGKQINFLINKDLGFKSDGVVVIDIQENQEELSRRHINRFRELTRDDLIQSVAGSNLSFGQGSSRYPLELHGNRFSMYQQKIDYDFIYTLSIKLIDGRNFSRKFSTDTSSALINEKFAGLLRNESDQLIGKTIGEVMKNKSAHYPYNLKIIGIVEDYNITSLRNEISPAIFHMQPGWGIRRMFVRIAPINISRSLEILNSAWSTIQSEKPFIYTFLDDDLRAQYREEKRWEAIVKYSSLFAILIACMGIFGLTSISINKRFKEIGIRKVVGARTGQIINLILKDFVYLVLVANICAFPVSFYVMTNILQNYHYRITIGIHYFFIAGFISLGLAVSTTIFLTIKAALLNPIESIKYE